VRPIVAARGTRPARLCKNYPAMSATNWICPTCATATASPFCPTSATRVAQVAVSLVGVGAIVLGYRFALFLLTFYTAG
jgi:energy-converting hydrogenase Eha subunit E